MTARPVIIGAGLSGLIAASMLRGQISGILERQSSIPNNHAALLRFRSSVVGDATGIPFRKVQVMKAVMEPENPVKDAIDYSIKVTGSPAIRSINSAQGRVEQRWIAPSDFIQRLAEQSAGAIAFDVEFSPEEFRGQGCPVISTIPMPTLMKLLDYPHAAEFKSREGWVITCDLRWVDFCATLYYPRRTTMQYRASVTGNKLIIEGIGTTSMAELNARSIVNEAASDFGMYDAFDSFSIKIKQQPYAKILPIDDDVRKRFIMWASDKFNIYSLGRFATWRPGLLLDDVVNDVRVIQRMINGSSSSPYNARKSK